MPSQPCRSVRISSTSLRQTRGMAGARSSSYCAATRSSARSATSRIWFRRSRCTGSKPADCSSDEQIALHGVKQAAARERVHLFQRDRRLTRAQLMDRVQQKTIGADCANCCKDEAE